MKLKYDRERLSVIIIEIILSRIKSILKMRNTHLTIFPL